MNEDTPEKSLLLNPEDWVDVHGDALFGYAFRYINDRTIVEDLVQETFLAALKGRKQFAGISTERTWLIGILKNKIVDYYRKSARKSRQTSSAHSSDSDDTDYIMTGPEAGTWQPTRRPVAWSVDPNDPVEQQQFWEYLQKCLEDLDPRLARVYYLRDVQEIAYQEVCNMLAITPTNIRVMLHRARKLLRRCLEKQWVSS